MADELRLAIIGCAGFAHGFLYDTTKPLPVRLVAASDPKAEALARFAGRYHVPATYADWKEMIAREKPQAVLVFPQGLSLYEVNKACLEAGANVLTERPGCETRDQAADLARVEERTGRFAMARFNKRFIPAYRMAREVARRPEFGGATMYLAKYHAGEYASEQAFLESHIVHHVDLARYYLGDIRSIRGDIVRIGPKHVGVNASFVAESGAVGVLQSSSLQSRGSYPLERVEITGRERCVIVDNLTRIEYHRPGSPKTGAQPPVLSEGGDSLVWDASMTQLGNYGHNGFEAMMQELVSCTLEGRTPDLHMSEVVRTLELLDRLVASLR
jgi:predicted dehydrogenase